MLRFVPLQSPIASVWLRTWKAHRCRLSLSGIGTCFHTVGEVELTYLDSLLLGLVHGPIKARQFLPVLNPPAMGGLDGIG